ncbi:MAG: VWA domain-containing protein [Spirochaetales bacterium]|nr:VWA domain-containing protein [Spirochaetales bacterium]
MPTFSSPIWFSLYFLLPPLFWARYFWKNRGGRLIFPHRIWNGEGFVPPKSATRVIALLAEICFWSGFIILIAAMAGPRVVQREEVLLSRGIDMVVVLDQSPSMAARDFPPVSRFDSAREMIRRFVQGRSGDSIGLVTFGSEAVLRCPPTADYDWLIQRLEELELRELGDDTAIGMGLAVATLHLSESTARERLILLLTDGDGNAGEIRPDMAAQLAANNGIKIYAIGIGSQGEVPIEFSDPETGTVTRGTIYTDFDEDVLRKLADTTGGSYWRASSPGALETVFQAVDSLETVERRVSLRATSRPLHRPYILVGALLIIFSYVLRKIFLGEMP